MKDWSHAQWMAWLRQHHGSLRFLERGVEVRVGAVRRQSWNMSKAFRELYRAVEAR